MMQVDIGQLVALMGIPSAITGFCFWLVEHRMQRREKERDRIESERRKAAEKEADERHKRADARERAREELEIIIVQGNNAAIALAEATARAVQRIPDAHCNGDMHAALDYATKIKHAQKDFLTKQGIQALME